MTSIPTNRTYYQDRIERGVLMSTKGRVTQNSPQQWRVTSDTDSRLHYIVTPEGCTCPDAKKGQGICKHAWASIGYAAAVAILALREAADLATAEQIMTGVLPIIIDLPFGYRRTLKDEYEQSVKSFEGWKGYDEWSEAIEAKNAQKHISPADMLIMRECTHTDCKSTRCNYDVRIGGIAI